MPFPLGKAYPQTTYASHWGPVTANTNFCEVDHQFSPYVAELINTLSNVIYIIYAAHGLRLLHHRGRLSLTTALPHLGLIAVGLGSAAYHATLRKLPQLADEIGMAIPTGAVVSRLVSFRIRDKTKRRLVYGLTVALIVAVYVVHCVSFTNWVHYPAFGLMIHVVARRCAWLTRRIDDATLRRIIRRQSDLGEALFVGAFALWLVDRLFCDRLIRARTWLGLPWGWLLELHGWWHIGTGMGAFVFIAVSEFLMEIHDDDDNGNNNDNRKDERGNTVSVFAAAADDTKKRTSIPLAVDPGTRLSPFAIGMIDHHNDSASLKKKRKTTKKA